MRGILTACFVAFGFVSLGQAEEPKDPDAFLGVHPYVVAGPHVLIQRVRASVNSTVGANAREANTLTSMGFQFAGGLRGAPIHSLPGDPRWSVYGGFVIPFNESSVIGSTIDNENVGAASNKLETKLAVEYQTAYIAGASLEFEVPIAQTALTISPGLDYRNIPARYVGVATREVKLGLQQPATVRGGQQKKSLVQHFVGPSLRISVEPVELRGIHVTFFLEGNLLFDVAGTRRRFRMDTPQSSASFNFESGTSAGQISAGLRIQLP